MTRSTTLNQPGPIEAARRFGAVLLAPFAAIGRLLISLAENSPRMRALDALNHTSDAELAARGLNRDHEIRRILGVGAAV